MRKRSLSPQSTLPDLWVDVLVFCGVAVARRGPPGQVTKSEWQLGIGSRLKSKLDTRPENDDRFSLDQ
jgi:hypothetical protein